MKSYPLVRFAGEFLFLSALALLPVITVHTDLTVLETTTGEKSITEISQAIFLALTVLIFWRASWHYRNYRGAFVLIAGFFTCAFIRELDAVFDYVWHGFWIVPAIGTAIACIAYATATFGWKTIVNALNNLACVRGMDLLLFGLVTLLVFSRTFGSGSLIWNAIVPEDSAFTLKSALQEGLELYGYIFILYGSCKLSFHPPSGEEEIR